MTTEIRNLLGLIHSILSGNEVIDAIAQLNDIFEEHDIPRLPQSLLYYTGDYEDEYGFVFVEEARFSCPLQEIEFLSGLHMNNCSKTWSRLEEIDPEFLAANEDNHLLFDHMAEEDIKKLLGNYYMDYLEVKQEVERWGGGND